MDIYVYAENCVQAGRTYSGDDPENNSDVWLWGSGEPAALIQQALERLSSREDKRAGGAGDSYAWKCCRNVLALLAGPEVEYSESARAFLPLKPYRIAHVIGSDGSWDILEEFEATDDTAANAYAEANYADDPDWYVLDAAGDNING
jgi:hypothetical protein